MLLVRGILLVGLLCLASCMEQQIVVTNEVAALRAKRGFDVGFLFRNLLLNSAQVSNAKYPPPPPPPMNTTEAPTTMEPPSSPPPPPPPPPPRRIYPGKYGPWHGYDYFDYYDAPAETTQPPPPPTTTTTAAPTTMPPPPPRTPEYFGLFGNKFGPWLGSGPLPTTPTPAPPTMSTTQPPPPPTSPAPPATRRPKPRPKPLPVPGPYFFATPAPLPHYVNQHYGQPFGDYGTGHIHVPNYYSDYDYYQAYLPPQPLPQPPRKRPAAPQRPAPTSPPPPPPSPPPQAPAPRRPPFNLRQKLAFLYAQPDDTSSDDTAGATADAADAADAANDDDDASSNSNNSNDTNPGNGNATDDGADAPNSAASATGSDADVVGSSYSNVPYNAYPFNQPSTGGAAFLQPTQFGAQYF